MNFKTPIIAVVGRPNVGKSTLFNRVCGSNRAVVEDIAGVTRDRNYAYVETFPVPFYVVDTGGFEKDPEGELQQLVVEQAVLAAEEADVVIAVFDAKTGVHPGDDDVVDLLRRYRKPVIFAANKCDGKEHEPSAAEFYQLGVDHVYGISALHNRGVKELIKEALHTLPDFEQLVTACAEAERREEDAAQQMEAVLPEITTEEELEEPQAREVAEEEEPVFAPVYEGDETEEYDRAYRLLPLDQSKPLAVLEREPVGDEHEEREELPELRSIRIAIVGRPNVGKSTLLNTLIGEQRAITSPIAGTTRDSLNLTLKRDGQEFVLVDTAGLRKKARVSDKIEKYSTMRALHAISECDVAAVVLDAVEGPGEQDAKIVGLAHEQGKGIIIVLNKWDLVEKDHKAVQQFKQRLKEEFKFSPYAPILFASALTGKKCSKIFAEAKRVAVERAKRVSTYHLNRMLSRALQRVSAPSYRGQPIKLYYAAQVDSNPPRFVLFLNYPRQVHFSYLRFIKNAIREEFGFEGTDIKFVLRKR